MVEVAAGSHALRAGVRVGDILRGTTAVRMQMIYPTANLMFGGAVRASSASDCCVTYVSQICAAFPTLTCTLQVVRSAVPQCAVLIIFCPRKQTHRLRAVPWADGCKGNVNRLAAC